LIPLRDANPVRSIPIVNRLLLAVNLAAWIYVVYLTRQPGALDAFFDRYSFDWLEFTRRIASGDIGVETFIPLITHMFLHGGWLHLILNMWTLYLFGPAVEDRLGSGRYLVFYLICGLVASFAHAIFNPTSTVPALGASGAISGVLGSFILMFPLARLVIVIPILFFPFFFQIPAIVFAGFWFFTQITAGVAELFMPSQGGGIAWWAHTGGFVAGLALTPLLHQSKAPYRNYEADEGVLGFDPQGRP
jgi:membrane associated rhomboid family serine protease